MATTNAQTLTINGVTHQMEDTVARQLIASLQTALDALTGTDDTTAAINTMNEVVAFLNGLTNTDTLTAKLLELSTAIAAKQDTISDLSAIRSGASAGATAVQPATLSGYVQSSTLSDYYTKAEIDGKGYITEHQSLADYVTTTTLTTTLASYALASAIPTKVSDLTNDSGFIASIATPLVEESQTGNVTKTIDCDKYYRFGTCDSLALTLNAAASGMVAAYFGRFTTSANWGGDGLSFVGTTPTTASSNDTIEASGTYEFSLIDGILKVNKV